MYRAIERDLDRIMRGEETVWYDASPGLFAGLRINPYRTRLKGAPDGRRSTLGQVFVDGELMREADTEQELEETPGRWMVAADCEILQVHFPRSAMPPRERLVEITIRDRVFAPHRRGLGYIAYL